jgi:hypothetical protein
LLAARLGISKKAVIERAILTYSKQVELEEDTDVFNQTCGAWRRKEPAEQTVEHARQAFRHGMNRHQDPSHETPEDP